MRNFTSQSGAKVSGHTEGTDFPESEAGAKVALLMNFSELKLVDGIQRIVF